MGNKYKNLTKNTIVFVVSSFGTKVLSFLLIPLYTNVLTTSEYGIADVITASSTLLVSFFTINIASAVLRFAIDKHSNQEEILSYGIRVIYIGSLLLAGLLAIAGLINYWNWEDYYYFFVFLNFISSGFYQLITNYLRATDKVIDVGVAGIISSIVIISSNIYFLLIARIGIVGYLLSLNLGPIIGSVYCITRSNVPIKSYLICSCPVETRRKMKSYCIPLIFNDVALWINVFLDKYFVTIICGADQNGIYAVANKIPTILATVYMVFTQAWNLSAIQEFDGQDNDNFFSNVYSLYNATIVLACSVLILMNTTIAKILFAKEFYDAWEYSSILLIAIMYNAMTSFQGSIFSAVKDTKILAKTTVISAVVNICLNAILIPILNVKGAAIATVVSYFVMWCIRHFKMKKHIQLHHNYIIDFIVYNLLVVQVVMEHTKNHMFIGQIFILLIVLFVYGKNYVSLFVKLLNKIKKGTNT